jgi:hypothetical protein
MSYKQQILRGVQLEESANKVQLLLDRLNSKYEESLSGELHLPQLSLAGFRLPRNLEDLGIFCVGSPGSGKTQALAKLISELQQRDDFRIVCFDRNGEFTASFYRSSQDILFNPTDERSVGWCHQSESASAETIAAGIIPFDQTIEPFWPISARNLLSEIYNLTQTNQEVWWIIATQTVAQIDQIYGRYERQILLQGTATKLILNCRDPDSARTMAEIIGNQEVLEEYRDSQGKITSAIRERSVVMPSEIQNLPALLGYLMLGSGTPIVKAEITPTDYPAIAPRLLESSSAKSSSASFSSTPKSKGE